MASSLTVESEIPDDKFSKLDPYTAPPGSKTINQVLDEARSHLQRLLPVTVHHILNSSPPSSPPSVLIDIRPPLQAQAEGKIKGALCIERNVLEWRLDPTSSAQLSFPWGKRWDVRVIVFCSEGYTSSLAARSLQELGLENATDMLGGYKAVSLYLFFAGSAGFGSIGIEEARHLHTLFWRKHILTHGSQWNKSGLGGVPEVKMI